VAVLESQGSGHRFAYVSRLVAGAAALGASTAVVVPATVRHAHKDEWGAHLRGVENLFHPVLVVGYGAFDRRLLRIALSAGDLLCIPDGDFWLPVLLRERLLGVTRRKTPVVLLVMRPYPPKGLLPRAKFLYKSSLMVLLQGRIFRTRIGVLKSSGSSVPPHRPGMTIVRDPPLSTRPLPDRDGARRAAGLTTETVVSILGVVGPRKSPGLVLEALELLMEQGTEAPWVLYLPGELEPGVGEDLASRARLVRVVIGGRYLDAAGYTAAIAASDVVAVVHKNEGSSGVLNEVAAYGKRAVAGGVRSVREQGAALGAVVPTDGSAQALAEALRRAQTVAPPDLHVEPESSVSFEDFFLNHLGRRLTNSWRRL
jgi:hypothetical protein